MKSAAPRDVIPSPAEKLLATVRSGESLLLTTSAGVQGWADGPKVPAYPALTQALEAASREGAGPSVLRGQPFSGNLREAGVPEETIFWIEAGDLFEQLILEAGRNRLSTVVALDPWAAALIGKANPLPGPDWIYLFHRYAEETPQDGGYGRVLERWALELPFQEKLPLSQCLDVLPGGQSEIDDPKPPSSRNSEEAYVPWRWKVIGPSLAGRVEPPLVALVIRGADRLHLRVLLDSLVRQGYPLHRVRLFTEPDTREPLLAPFMAMVRLAHPTLEVAAVSDDSTPLPRGEYEKKLSSCDIAVVLDCRTVLSPGFLSGLCELAGREEPLSISRVALRRDVSAHILLGNLDCFEHYESLREAHRPAESAENAAGTVCVLPRKALKGMSGLGLVGVPRTVSNSRELLALSDL